MGEVENEYRLQQLGGFERHPEADPAARATAHLTDSRNQDEHEQDEDGGQSRVRETA